MQGIPFATDDVHGGLSEGRGTLRLDGDDVVLEVQVSLLGMFGRDPKEYRFDITDLDSVRHQRNVFRDCLTLRTTPMSIVTQVPGSNEGRLRLKIKRRHRAAVDALLERIEMWVEE